MKILFLAPQPFFQERGTPIAVRLALEVLSARGADQIDLLTYHEGQEISIPRVNIHRIPALGILKNIGPGVSLKKLLCDLLFFLITLQMVWKNRNKQYDLIHAVEESVFIALFIKIFFRIPYVYDMDSSLAMQLTEKWFLLKPLYPIFSWFERIAVTQSTAVVPVCDALETLAVNHGASDTQILRDISLLDVHKADLELKLLRDELNLSPTDLIVLYIGNLESYQGVDLLIDSFCSVAHQHSTSHLVIIGGITRHIEACKLRAEERGYSNRVHLLGPRPVSTLNHYLMQADILASPRVRGNNTPMKIYSYLHSGKAVIATDLPTHTQVMDSGVAALAYPSVPDFGKALLELLTSETRRLTLGRAAQTLAEEKYTLKVFTQSLNALYDRLEARVSGVLVS